MLLLLIQPLRSKSKSMIKSEKSYVFDELGPFQEMICVFLSSQILDSSERLARGARALPNLRLRK